MNLAFAPVADRFDPQRWAKLPMRVVVAEDVEDPAALQESETLGIGVGESGDLQGFAIGQRPPDPFVLAGQHLQAGDIVDVGADVVRPAMVERAEGVGRAHRAHAQFVDRDAGDKREFGVDDRRFERAQREPEGAGQARRIEQRVKNDHVGGRAGLLDPQAAEKRELLAGIVAGANRQPARRHAEKLAARERAEEGRALKNRDVMKS